METEIEEGIARRLLKRGENGREERQAEGEKRAEIRNDRKREGS